MRLLGTLLLGSLLACVIGPLVCDAGECAQIPYTQGEPPQCGGDKPAELYKFQSGVRPELFSRVCCDLSPKEMEDQRGIYTGCQAAPCVASSDPCSSIETKWVLGEKIELEEILIDKCKMADGKQGYNGLCCPKNSEEGKMATLSGAELNEFPHQAKLKIGRGNCGGTIYNKKFILTAAHCVVDKSKKIKPKVKSWTATLGTNNANAEEDEFVYKVKNVKVHDGYSQWDESTTYKPDDERVYNDVALLELQKEITFSDTVKSLEIAPAGFQPERYADHLVMIGWGVTNLGKGSAHMNKGSLPIRRDDHCYANPTSLNEWTYHTYADKKDQLLCVGGKFDGDNAGIAGQGDSGGPAICRGEDGKPVQCGITSFGADARNCSRDKNIEMCTPTNFGEVAYFRDWIQEHAGKQDSSTFYKPYLYGAPVPQGKYDHQVHITSSSGKPCGGTLISPDVVVTAAQCVFKGNKQERTGLKVTHGIRDLNSGGGKSYNVVGAKSAPKFAQKKWEFDSKKDEKNLRLFGDNMYKDDLAVIKLDKPVQISGKFPSLPDLGEDYETAKVTEIAFPKKTTISGELRSRDYRILSFKECQRRMNRLKDMAFKVDQSSLCGVEKYSGGSMCDRELGGGLICEKGGKKMLCGVQVLRMCEGSLPNGYVNLQMFANWLEEAKNQL